MVVHVVALLLLVVCCCDCFYGYFSGIDTLLEVEDVCKVRYSCLVLTTE